MSAIETGPSLFLLALIFPLVAYLAASGRSQALLLLGFLQVALPQGDWQIAGIRLGPMDLMIAGIVTAIAVNPGSASHFRQIPFIRVWALLGILTSIAYVLAPINADHLTDPLRGGYQVFRYCWKPIVFYPLTFMLIGNAPDRRLETLHVILIAAVIISIHASIQGYSGRLPVAYIAKTNAFGGCLVAPFVVACACMTRAGSRRRMGLYLGAVAIIARGIVFANSRGAFTATVAGILVLFGMMLTWTGGRRALVQFVGIGLAGIVTLFALKPDLLQRPNVAHMLTAVHGTEDSNYQWRSEQRWPHFIEIIKANPWFGIGTDQDLELGEQGNTPHNGYLSIAVTRGVPVVVLTMLFGVVAIANGLKIARRQRSAEERIFGVLAIAAVTGVMVHNIVESTLLQVAFVQNLYWTFAGLTSAAALSRPVVARAPARLERTTRVVRRRPLRSVLQQES